MERQKEGGQLVQWLIQTELQGFWNLVKFPNLNENK